MVTLCVEGIAKIMSVIFILCRGEGSLRGELEVLELEWFVVT